MLTTARLMLRLPDAGDWLQINNGGPWVPESLLLDGGFLEWLKWFPRPAEKFDALGDELQAAIDATMPLYENPENGAR